jgi:hypothetical protein
MDASLEYIKFCGTQFPGAESEFFYLLVDQHTEEREKRGEITFSVTVSV